MRTRKHFLATLLVILAFILPALTVRAQVTPNTLGNALTNGTTVIIDATADQSNIVASTVVNIDLRKDRGIGFQATIGSTNAATLQTGISFALSVDGSNYTTANNYWFIIPALNGTAPVTAFTNFPPALVGNARKIRVLQITNGHTASLFVSNITYSFSN